jgi:hypothetical protein
LFAGTDGRKSVQAYSPDGELVTITQTVVDNKVTTIALSSKGEVLYKENNLYSLSKVINMVLSRGLIQVFCPSECDLQLNIDLTRKDGTTKTVIGQIYDVLKKYPDYDTYTIKAFCPDRCE